MRSSQEAALFAAVLVSFGCTGNVDKTRSAEGSLSTGGVVAATGGHPGSGGVSGVTGGAVSMAGSAMASYGGAVPILGGASSSTGGTANASGGATVANAGAPTGGVSFTGGRSGTASGGVSFTGGRSETASGGAALTGGRSGTASGGAALTGGSATIALSTSTSTVTGGTTATSGCLESEQTLPRLNVVFLIDKSGSMGDASFGNAATRWNPVVNAIDAFVKDPASANVRASLSLLPADGDNNDACSASSYSSGTASLKIPLSLLDDSGRQQFLSRLCDPANASASTCIKPAGGTPTRPAIQGTIDYAASVRAQYPKDKTLIVFVTDGEPGFGYVLGSTVIALSSCDDLSNGCTTDTVLCTSNNVEAQKIASVIQAAPSRSIYLIGVGDLSVTTMNLWAASSGNAATSVEGMTESQVNSTLTSALSSIRSSSRSCNLDIPLPSVGTAVDPSKLNVDYVEGSTVTHLVRSDNCTSSSPSWHFDSPTGPTKIVICPNACTPAQQSAAGSFKVIVGCALLPT